MEIKRLTLLAGHYGSGKTNIAVNWAKYLKDSGYKVSVADLDIVNPYFRTKDSEKDFKEWGIRFISSPYANSGVDLPALPQEMYSIIDDKSYHSVVDIGGDDRGAFALGRYSPGIVAEANFEFAFVINCYRPLTNDAESTIEIKNEIETACGMQFTSIINNSNLGRETTPEVVLRSIPYAKRVAELSGLPIKMTTVEASLFEKLEGKIENLFSLRLQNKLI